MAVALMDGTPSNVLAALEQLLSSQSDFGEEFENIELGDWASVHIYLPHPDVDSAITPPFMEAFLALQKQIYQLAAFTQTGLGDAGQLTENEKRELQLSVVVSGRSSNLDSSLKRPLLALLRKMVGRLTGKQSATVIIAIAALTTTYWGWGAWLDHTKQIKTDELKSRDHQAALQAIQFSNTEEREIFKKIVGILEQQGSIGQRAIDAITQTNDSLLRAAASTPKSEINRVEITRQEAEILRTPSRRKVEPKVVQQRIRALRPEIRASINLQKTLAKRWIAGSVGREAAPLPGNDDNWHTLPA